MASSSVKKMRKTRRDEGNHASSINPSQGRITSHDLGLTLLPRSQTKPKGNPAPKAAGSISLQPGCNGQAEAISRKSEGIQSRKLKSLSKDSGVDRNRESKRWSTERDPNEENCTFPTSSSRSSSTPERRAKNDCQSRPIVSPGQTGLLNTASPNRSPKLCYTSINAFPKQSDRQQSGTGQDVVASYVGSDADAENPCTVAEVNVGFCVGTKRRQRAVFAEVVSTDSNGEQLFTKQDPKCTATMVGKFEHEDSESYESIKDINRNADKASWVAFISSPSDQPDMSKFLSRFDAPTSKGAEIRGFVFPTDPKASDHGSRDVSQRGRSKSIIQVPNLSRVDSTHEPYSSMSVVNSIESELRGCATSLYPKQSIAGKSAVLASARYRLDRKNLNKNHFHGADSSLRSACSRFNESINKGSRLSNLSPIGKVAIVQSVLRPSPELTTNGTFDQPPFSVPVVNKKGRDDHIDKVVIVQPVLSSSPSLTTNGNFYQPPVYFPQKTFLKTLNKKAEDNLFASRTCAHSLDLSTSRSFRTAHSTSFINSTKEGKDNLFTSRKLVRSSNLSTSLNRKLDRSTSLVGSSKLDQSSSFIDSSKEEKDNLFASRKLVRSSNRSTSLNCKLDRSTSLVGSSKLDQSSSFIDSSKEEKDNLFASRKLVRSSNLSISPNRKLDQSTSFIDSSKEEKDNPFVSRKLLRSSNLSTSSNRKLDQSTSYIDSSKEEKDNPLASRKLFRSSNLSTSPNRKVEQSTSCIDSSKEEKEEKDNPLASRKLLRSSNISTSPNRKVQQSTSCIDSYKENKGNPIASRKRVCSSDISTSQSFRIQYFTSCIDSSKEEKKNHLTLRKCANSSDLSTSPSLRVDRSSTSAYVLGSPPPLLSLRVNRSSTSAYILESPQSSPISRVNRPSTTASVLGNPPSYHHSIMDSYYSTNLGQQSPFSENPNHNLDRSWQQSNRYVARGTVNMMQTQMAQRQTLNPTPAPTPPTELFSQMRSRIHQLEGQVQAIEQDRQAKYNEVSTLRRANVSLHNDVVRLQDAHNLVNSQLQEMFLLYNQQQATMENARKKVKAQEGLLEARGRQLKHTLARLEKLPIPETRPAREIFRQYGVASPPAANTPHELSGASIDTTCAPSQMLTAPQAFDSAAVEPTTTGAPVTALTTNNEQVATGSQDSALIDLTVDEPEPTIPPVVSPERSNLWNKKLQWLIDGGSQHPLKEGLSQPRGASLFTNAHANKKRRLGEGQSEPLDRAAPLPGVKAKQVRHDAAVKKRQDIKRQREAKKAAEKKAREEERAREKGAKKAQKEAEKAVKAGKAPTPHFQNVAVAEADISTVEEEDDGFEAYLEGIMEADAEAEQMPVVNADTTMVEAEEDAGFAAYLEGVLEAEAEKETEEAVEKDAEKGAEEQPNIKPANASQPAKTRTDDDGFSEGITDKELDRLFEESSDEEE
ncbi:hypothetical protein MMC06_005342 [Schaereria dolodes]|nr:hypothetical protein [Schaereria dolodes]